MTRDAFLARLAHTPRTWKVDEWARIRCADGKCPIVAVEGIGRSNSEVEAAALAIGISRNNGCAIVAAADKFSDHYPKLRQQLLVATGLAPQPENK